ncbi:MAG: SGNH/GDSL hydrolase family protein [Ruminococcaceae bacterium]|nr:SGNH/GDSL hydrolase family protein [Oscillospiraceae bacterium]
MKKTLILCTCILLVTVLCLGFVQMLVTPKYMTDTLDGALIGEYYREKTPHDVVFIGDCEVYECFTPPTLWQEYGITSYVRGSAQQLIWQSYYLMEETLKRENPKAVVFNVLSIKYGEPQNEAYNRMTLDGMKWSGSKLRSIYASKTEEESVISYVFPLLRYHSRWSDLTKEDWKYLFHRDTVSHNGYLMQTGVKPKTSNIPGRPLVDYTLPEIGFEYLEKMRLLCEENGTELILIKAPTNDWKYYWYDEWDAQITAWANEKGVDYYNFIPLAAEIGLDWSTDTYDGGVHLNVFGAEKLTSYFGKILAEKYGISDRRGDVELDTVWADKVAIYQKERNGETQ